MENDQRSNIPEENIYLNRGCCKKPSLEDTNRTQQMQSCAKLHVFDWAENFPASSENNFNIVEVRFKNSRKEFCRIEDAEVYLTGDIVAVESTTGHDMGIISLSGPLVKLQMKKRGITPTSENIKKIYRKARQVDIDKWNQCIQIEKETQRKARQIAADLGLSMKINDVEYQGDMTKAIFYYTADDRVDFRQLIKMYAEAFRVRIEMKQIGARQEAGHLGGIGSCGRELCCVSCINNFNSVSTYAARIQQISLNPQKLAGQCSKLKCCLNYEFEMYQEAIRHFPDQDMKIQTKQGPVICVKIDVFKEKMYLAYEKTPYQFFEYALEEVKKLIGRNQKGEVFESLESLATKEKQPEKKIEIGFENVVGQDDLTRFDKKKNNLKSKNRNRQKSPVGDSSNQQENKKQNFTQTTPKTNQPHNRQPHKDNRPEKKNDNQKEQNNNA